MLSSYFSLIYRSQRTKIPLQPKTIAEFEELINEAKNHKRYAYDDAGNILYRGVWHGLDGMNVAFVSERTLQAVSKLKDVTLLMDGTFKAIPRHLKFVQLYIINVIIRDKCFPLAYVLMERKNFFSYMNVFRERPQVSAGAMLKPRLKKETVRLNKKIKKATKLFNKTEDVAQFFDNITFNDELANIFNVRESHDGIDEFDEEIITY